MILVTGASGFLGAEIVKQLIGQGARVRIIRRPFSDISHFKDIQSQLDIVEGDVLDITSLETAMNGVAQVYHAAAIISYDGSEQNQMYKTNVEGTANVVNMAIKSGVQKILYVSSIAAIGAKPNKEVIDESSKWEKHPYNTYYGITKMMAEREIFRGIEEGVPAVMINPGIIIGVGHDAHKATMRVFKKIAKKQLPFYPRGSNGFVDVTDVARASILLMNSAISGERFIAVSENWSFKKYFDTIAGSLQVPPPQSEIKPWLGSILWRLDWLQARVFGKKRTLTKENWMVMNEDFVYNNEKIKSALHFNFKPLSQSIQEIAREYKNEQIQ